VTILVLISEIVLVCTILILTAYAVRHHLLVLSRMSLEKPRDMMELVGYTTPHVSVVVPMHNEEEVAADVLQALVDCDYDWGKLEILAINDRSEDRTGEIINEFAARYPVIRALHRAHGDEGKGAALRFATSEVHGEIILLFDADYVPARSMLRFLVAPFSDPEVGAVMGRVVPHNGGASLLAGLLELERGAGYQIGQQARFNLGLTPQFGGTVGGVRASVLAAVGGWNAGSLTEDTDLTFRVAMKGWKVAYVNRAECYEEAPESWLVRSRQIRRWATGHTECLHRLWRDWLHAEHLGLFERIDGLFVLGCYWTAPVLVLGWLASLVLFFTPHAHVAVGLLAALTFVGYQLFGNQATFLELGSAALLDGNRRRALLLPLNLFNFFASTGAICRALLGFYARLLWGSRGNRWHKTRRFRNGNGNGLRNGNGRGGDSSGDLLVRSSNGLYLYKEEAKLR
jgi:cellulose synthase/poly-beta-1,6-N-acetylglucosamine synthase-like glycosyltransferase